VILKSNREEEVMNLEKLEMELITKLQHTQKLQKGAYEELETALSQPLETYTQKYGEIDFFRPKMSKRDSRGDNSKYDDSKESSFIPRSNSTGRFGSINRIGQVYVSRKPKDIFNHLQKAY